MFASAAEIQKYLFGVCEKYGLRERIRLGHRIVRAVWEEEGSGVWVLSVRDESTGREFEDTCHFLLNSGRMSK